MPPPRMVGDSRQSNPLRWGRARDRRRTWQLRAFAAWRWALRWRWYLAWYAAWDPPDAAEEVLLGGGGCVAGRMRMWLNCV